MFLKAFQDFKYMLSKTQLKEIKEELDNCSNPVFLYDNDTDGVTSFLLFYKYKKAGHGYRHQKHMTDEIELGNIKRMNPDKLFILDVPAGKITQDFIDGLKIPVIHVEHHLTDNKLKGVKTFNPTIKNKKDDTPTSTLCYNVVKQNLWLCAAGTIADWHITKETKEFAKKYPDLLDYKIKDQAKALFETKIGLLAKIIDFILKGPSFEVRKYLYALMKVNSPEEILEQTTKEGKEIYSYYKKINDEYESLLQRAVKNAGKDKLLLFEYQASETSFTGELSNELLYRYPDKIILIARRNNKENDVDAEIRCSVRSGTHEVRSKLIKALKGINGMGGGHARAVGATIRASDFDRFVEQFRKLI